MSYRICRSLWLSILLAGALMAPPAVRAAVDLVIQSQGVSATTVRPGSILHASGIVKNLGTSSAGRSKVHFYLSNDPALDGSDDFLKGALVGLLAAGATSLESGELILPEETRPGTWYILFVADASGEVAESDEGNNVVSRQITVSGPDLVVQNPSVSTSSVVAGETLNASCTVQNTGDDGSGGSRIYFLLSPNATYETSDEVLKASLVPTLSPGETFQVDRDLVIPEGTAAGAWYILCRVDPKNEVLESQEGNNVVSEPITIGAPDLAVTNISLSTASIAAGGGLNVACTVKNLGTSSSPSNRLYYFLSSNTTHGASDTFLKADLIGSLEPSATRTVDADVTIPEVTTPGTWYVLCQADPNQEVDESNESNNLGYNAVIVGAAPLGDLVVHSQAIVPTTVQPSEDLQVSSKVENIGHGTVATSFMKYYLSRDTTFDSADKPLGADWIGSLVPGEKSPESAQLTIPEDTTAGTWYVLFRADADDDVTESHEGNNTSTAILTVGGVSAFNDLGADHWAYPAALFLFEQGWLVPDGSGNIRPEESAIRAELAKLAFLAAGIPPLADNFPNPFNDLQDRNPSTEWYYSYAKNLSYLEYGDGISAFTRDRFNFYPSRTISRAHTLKVLLETWNVPIQHGGMVPYSDVSHDHDAFDYIYTALTRGLIDGSATTFRPDEAVLRAEIFVMLHNIMVKQSVVRPPVFRGDFFTAGNYTPANLGSRRSLLNGNFEQYVRTSFQIPGFHLPLIFEHRYNSYLTELPDELFPLRPLGHGWSHSYNAYVLEIGELLVVVWPDGTMHIYRDIAGDLVSVTRGVYDEIHRASTTRLTIKKKNQTVFTFDRLAGTPAEFPYVLTKVHERNNKSLTLFYEPSERPGKTSWQRLWKVTGTAGRSLFLSYHPGSDLLKSVEDPINRRISFAYTSYDHATADLKHFVDAKDQRTSYSYNATTPGRHLLQYISFPDGKTVTNTYAERKLHSSRRGLARPVLIDFDPDYNQTGDSAFETFTVTSEGRSPIGYVTRRNGQPERITGAGAQDITFEYGDPSHPTLPTTVNGANGIALNLTYDANGNVLRVDRPLGVSENFTYNWRNDMLSYTDPRGQVTTLGYDADGNLASITDPMSRTTSLTHTSSGLMETITSPAGVTVTLGYDTHGNLTSASMPLGLTASATYDGVGRIRSTTSPRGIVTRFSYDANDNLEVAEGPTATSFSYTASDLLNSVTDASGDVTFWSYNNENLLDSLSFQGKSINYSYYEDGLMSSRTDPDGVTTTFVYDELGRPRSDSNGNSYQYDSRGNLRTATNALGTVTFTYDALNRLGESVDPFGNRVSYDYDKAGNITAITYPGNKVVSYVYHDDGRLQSVEDWLGNLTSYLYRVDGQLDEIRYANGIVCHHEYDLAGRLIEMRYEGDLGVLASYAYQLDEVGNHEAVSGIEPLESTPRTSKSVTMTYDRYNRIQTANSTAFVHDANGRVISKGNRTFDYNRRNLLTRVSGDVELEYSYECGKKPLFFLKGVVLRGTLT